MKPLPLTCGSFSFNPFTPRSDQNRNFSSQYLYVNKQKADERTEKY